MRIFKRSTNFIVTFLLFAVGGILAVIWLIMFFSYDNATLDYSNYLEIILTYILLFCSIGILTSNLIPPDFEYIIHYFDETFVIEFSQKEKIELKYTFTIVDKNRKHILLSEGGNLVPLCYNAEFYDFLSRLQKNSSKNEQQNTTSFVGDMGSTK